MHSIHLSYSSNLGIILSPLSEFLLCLPCSQHILNHLGFIHASASYSLAEISSGHLLSIHFKELANLTTPLVRSSSIKYCKLSKETLYTRARFINTNVDDIFNTLMKNKKTLVHIQVRVVTLDNTLVALAKFEWILSLKFDKISDNNCVHFVDVDNEDEI